MRYDLEFNVVSQLSFAGLSELAEIFYGEDQDTITPSQWDTQTLIDKAQSAASIVDTSKYNNMEDVPSWLYMSGVAALNDVSISKIVARNNIITPMFNAGSVYFNKYEFKWSNNTIRKKFQFDEVTGYYKCEVDSDIDPESIQAFTLRFKYPGYVAYEKTWDYVDFIEDDQLTLSQNLKETFKSYPNKDHKLTVVTDDNGSYAYINGNKISLSSKRLGVAYANKGSIMALGEYPVDETTVTIDGYDPSQGEYRLFTSTMVFKNITNSDINVDINYDVTPIITYNQTGRQNTDDVVYTHANILPSVIGFGNGAIGIHNVGSAGGTIQTDDGVNIVIPTGLELQVERTNVSVLDSVRCTARLTGLEDMPVKDATIRFELSSISDDVRFLESGTASYSTKTSIDGRASANAFIDRSRFGWYVQKEWVSGNQIKLPFDIKTDREDEIYLYLITSDDPILGKLFAKQYDTPLEEFYSTEESLETYEVSGRKIAYVKLMNRSSGGANIVYSSFIKPTLIKRDQTFTFRFKDLFIEGSNQSIIDFAANLPAHITMSLLTPVVSYTAESKGYTAGTLPGDTLSLYEAKTTDGTIIEFYENIPAFDNIIGYWLITGSSSDVSVKAIFDDANSFIHLESNAISITTGNYIRSEYEFILTDSDSDNQNTALSSFGYYTVSEYLENPYKQNACTYTCVYSDPITRKCTFSNGVYDTYYENDGDSGICIKPAQNDTLPVGSRCPVTTQQYLEDSNGDPIFQQEEIITDVFLDIYRWNDPVNFLTYNGKEPHVALYDGDITQGTFDTMVNAGDIIPVYEDNPDYDPRAWGYINPFIMHAEKPA